MADGRTHRRHARHGGLQQDQRPRLVQRRHHQQVGRHHQRPKFRLRAEAEEGDAPFDTQATRQFLHLAAKRVHAGDPHLEVHSRVGQDRQRAQQGRLVLHPVEAGYMDQFRRRVVTRPWLQRLPCVRVDTQGHAFRRNAQGAQGMDDRGTRRGHDVRQAQDRRLAQPAPPLAPSAIADGVQRDQLAARDVHEGWKAERFRRHDADQAAVPGEDRLDHVEGRASMFGTDRGDGTPYRTALAYVVYRRAAQRPGSRPGFLVQYEYMHFMRPCEAPDQGEEHGDHPLLATPVHATGKHHRDLHAASSPPATWRYASAHRRPRASYDKAASK